LRSVGQFIRHLSQIAVDEALDFQLLGLVVQRQVGGAAQGLGQEEADVLGEVGVLDTLDQTFTHDDMAVQILHGKEVHLRVVEVDPRRVLGHERVFDLERFGLDSRPVDGQRPVAAHQAQVRQRLFDDHGALRVGFGPDPEDQVQVAVADLFGDDRLVGAEDVA